MGCEGERKELTPQTELSPKRRNYCIVTGIDRTIVSMEGKLEARGTVGRLRKTSFLSEKKGEPEAGRLQYAVGMGNNRFLGRNNNHQQGLES